MGIAKPVRYVKSDRVICDANDFIVCEFNSEYSTGYEEGICAEAIVAALNEWHDEELKTYAIAKFDAALSGKEIE